MEIERSGIENKATCKISAEELKERGVSPEELAYRSFKTDRIFQDAVELACRQYKSLLRPGAPVVIEATPMADGSLELTIYSGDDSDELDPRFSTLALFDDDIEDADDDYYSDLPFPEAGLGDGEYYSDDEPDEGGENGGIDVEKYMEGFFAFQDFLEKEDDEENDADELKRIMQLRDESLGRDTQSEAEPGDDIGSEEDWRKKKAVLYCGIFKNLLKAAVSFKDYKDDSRLYSLKGAYVLVLDRGTVDAETAKSLIPAFKKCGNYGEVTKAGEARIKEHGKLLIDGGAVAKLAALSKEN